MKVLYRPQRSTLDEAMAEESIERIEKRCQYCHEDSEGYSTAFGAFWVEYSVREGWLLHAGKCKPRPINYCPICGRRLNNEQRAEKA